MMAQRGRCASYTGAKALRIILQSDDDSGQEDSDVSDDAKDDPSEPSDYSDSESIQPAPDGNNGVNNLPADQNPHEPVGGRGCARVHAQGPGRDRGRGHGRGCGRGRGRGRKRGRGQVDRQNHDEDHGDENPAAQHEIQDVLVGRNGTVWQENPPNVGRRQPQNIIGQAPGITNAVNCTSPVEAFDFFITLTMIDLLVLETNREARRQVTAWNEINPDNPKTWLALDSNEMKAFIGLCILAGIYKSNHESVASLWSEKEGRPIFSAAMSRTRFTTILKYLRFDNSATCAERQATDKLAPFRDFWIMFQAQLTKFYIPGTDLCVDEQLVPFRELVFGSIYHQSLPSMVRKNGGAVMLIPVIH